MPFCGDELGLGRGTVTAILCFGGSVCFGSFDTTAGFAEDFGLGATIRGPGGALVALGGNGLPRPSLGMPDGLRFRVSAARIPDEVAGRAACSVPWSFSADISPRLLFGLTLPRASGGNVCAVFGLLSAGRLGSDGR